MTTPPPEHTPPPGDTPPPADTPPPPPPARHEPEPEHHGDSVADAITALTTTVGELANLIRSREAQTPDVQPVKRPWTHPAPRVDR